MKHCTQILAFCLLSFAATGCAQKQPIEKLGEIAPEKPADKIPSAQKDKSPYEKLPGFLKDDMELISQSNEACLLEGPAANQKNLFVLKAGTSELRSFQTIASLQSAGWKLQTKKGAPVVSKNSTTAGMLVMSGPQDQQIFVSTPVASEAASAADMAVVSGIVIAMDQNITLAQGVDQKATLKSIVQKLGIPSQLEVHPMDGLVLTWKNNILKQKLTLTFLDGKTLTMAQMTRL